MRNGDGRRTNGGAAMGSTPKLNRRVTHVEERISLSKGLEVRKWSITVRNKTKITNRK